MDKVGKYTLQIMEEAGWYNRWLFSRVSPHISGKILEVGAGTGNFTELLKEKGDLWAIDLDRVYVSDLRKKFKNKIHVGYGDIEKGKYFFKNEKFDTIVCMNVLEHIKNDNKALKNMNSLLEPGGRLVLLVPAHSFALGKLDEALGHYRRYSQGQLTKKIKKAGLILKQVNFLNFLGIWGWFFNSRIRKADILPRKQLKLFDFLSRPFLFLENFISPPMGLSILVIAEKK